MPMSRSCMRTGSGAVGVAVVLALGTAGCGGAATSGGTASSVSAAPSVSSASAAAAPDGAAALCSVWVDSDVAAGADVLSIDFAAGTPEQIQAGVKQFWARQEPILTSVQQQAPDQIKPDVETLLRLARQGRATGDVSSLLSPDLATADRNIDTYLLRQCGHPEVQVAATDTGYQGLPASIEAGTVAITLTNAGQEAHQVVLSRITEGFMQPFSEILNAPPGQRSQMATPLQSTDADPGQATTVWVPLTPGRYGVADYYPQGTTSAATPGTGPAHHTLGLVGEFTVT
jgi:hypothetical protein